jgi:hypothetical protein
MGQYISKKQRLLNEGVMRLSGLLRKRSASVWGLSPSQRKWAKGLPEKVIYKNVRTAWCSCCGSAFDAPAGETAECPHCHAKCRVEPSKQRKAAGDFYIETITTFRGWQVIRCFYVGWEARIGHPLALVDIREAFQKWCRPGQETVTLGRALTIAPYYARCPFATTPGLSPKRSDWYEEWMKLSVYPRKRILPEYVKYGLRPDDGKVSVSEAVTKVFSHPFLEALYKNREYDALEVCCRRADDVRRYWPSIRVALRHGLRIDSYGDYLDYLQDLEKLRRDLRSPVYVAPDDLTASEELVRLELRRIEEKRNAERMREIEAQIEERKREQLLRDEKEKESFSKRILPFAGLCIGDGTIEIRPLTSIEEFVSEADEMHHCVFTNRYYAKEGSLILSARHDGQRVETIELDLRSGAVLQSRGKYNSCTPYHEEILSLIQSNIDTVRKCLSA